MVNEAHPPTCLPTNAQAFQGGATNHRWLPYCWNLFQAVKGAWQWMLPLAQAS